MLGRCVGVAGALFCLRSGILRGALGRGVEEVFAVSS